MSVEKRGLNLQEARETESEVADAVVLRLRPHLLQDAVVEVSLALEDEAELAVVERLRLVLVRQLLALLDAFLPHLNKASEE